MDFIIKFKSSITFVSVFFTGVVCLPATVLVVAVRDADICLLVVSFSCFSASGFFVMVFVRGALAFGALGNGRGFVVGDAAAFTVVVEAAGLAAAVYIIKV